MIRHNASLLDLMGQRGGYVIRGSRSRLHSRKSSLRMGEGLMPDFGVEIAELKARVRALEDNTTRAYQESKQSLLTLSDKLDLLSSNMFAAMEQLKIAQAKSSGGKSTAIFILTSGIAVGGLIIAALSLYLTHGAIK